MIGAPWLCGVSFTRGPLLPDIVLTDSCVSGMISGRALPGGIRDSGKRRAKKPVPSEPGDRVTQVSHSGLLASLTRSDMIVPPREEFIHGRPEASQEGE